jgi:hypothetical protein
VALTESSVGLNGDLGGVSITALNFITVSISSLEEFFPVYSRYKAIVRWALVVNSGNSSGFQQLGSFHFVGTQRIHEQYKLIRSFQATAHQWLW